MKKPVKRFVQKLECKDVAARNRKSALGRQSKKKVTLPSLKFMEKELDNEK